ncbi:type II secretion system F family protein [Hyphomicrobium sp. 99]|uniref:type II secretion system F family protein n=1 Tax=Hyphomicrobium sp. 99 TaxID=1163419 RepID=UPI001FDA74EC|nr:type II secretion system F family protein [Hyphomicrobium sp. 99]
MTVYRYSAVTRSGGKLTGEMDAVSPASVVEYLHKLGHLAVDVSESNRAGQGKGTIGHISGKPSDSQITLFTRELAMLLKAGLPLDQSLGFLEIDARSKKLKLLIGNIAGLIRSGKSFHEALEAQGKAFPPIYVSMVRVAEASGTLEPVLDRIAQWREKAQKLRGKALSQVLYPSILIVVAIAAVTIMLLFVVPRFKQMIVQGGTTIPEQARIVIGASDWLLANGHYLLIGLSLAVLAVVFAWQRGLGRQKIETSLLRVPLIGTILQLNLTIRFCRALGILLENGVALPVAMKLVREVIGSKFAAGVLDETYDALRKGKSFLEPLSRSGLFPPVVVNMLRVGEETGNLTASLSHMADMFEEKLETSVQRTFTILEPVIILLVSGFVAGIIMSILSAVISVNDLAL